MSDISEIHSHFDPEEMLRFGFDPTVPADREFWIKTEPVTGDNPGLVQMLLDRYEQEHPEQ